MRSVRSSSSGGVPNEEDPSCDLVHAARIIAESPADWGAWLEINPGRADGVWLVRWKISRGNDDAPMHAYTKESLRFGWIDSVLRRADDPDRTMLWCAPRRGRSGWSALNKRLIAELEDEGRLEPAGRDAIAAARAGSWNLLDEVEQGIVPDDWRRPSPRTPAAAIGGRRSRGRPAAACSSD